MATGVYWIPDKMIDIFTKEWRSRNEESKEYLERTVGGTVEKFVNKKIDSIRNDLGKLSKRLGSTEKVSDRILADVVADLQRRIGRALASKELAARVTYTEIRFLLPVKASGQAPWAQAEKLVLALATFPRAAILSPKQTLSGLTTPHDDILAAMDVESDAILRDWKKDFIKFIKSGERAKHELSMLKMISNTNLSSKNKCKAALKLIDGDSLETVRQFILSKPID